MVGAKLCGDELEGVWVVKARAVGGVLRVIAAQVCEDQGADGGRSQVIGDEQSGVGVFLVLRVEDLLGDLDVFNDGVCDGDKGALCDHLRGAG